MIISHCLQVLLNFVSNSINALMDMFKILMKIWDRVFKLNIGVPHFLL